MASEPIFRRATRDDLPAIVDLLHDDDLGRGREDNARPIRAEYENAFEALARDENQYQLVVETDGAVVGTLQVTIVPGLARLGASRGQIEGVRIHPAHRGEGLGQAMLAWAIAHCRERRCRLVQLTTDKTRKDAHRFYERLGFRATHEGYKLTL